MYFNLFKQIILWNLQMQERLKNLFGNGNG